jgi:hypothetical protein
MCAQETALKLPADVRQLLQKRFDNRHREWLAAGSDSAPWPLDIPLGIPGEQLALQQLDATRAWVAAWQTWQGAGELHWAERRWRTLGTQRLPEFLRLDGPREIAQWLDATGRWDRAASRHARLAQRWPLLGQRFSKLFGILADYDDADIERLTALLGWIENNPASGLYLRQLPVPGLDTKWLDSRKGILTELVGGLRGADANGMDFYALCGIRQPPNLVRLRVLDPDLRARLGGLGDISAPIGDLANLPIRPERVLIVENLQCGLALGEMRGTVVFMALGKAVTVLAAIPWISSAASIYWGDIDTHGFAILDLARSCFPAMRSILMDENILMAHANLWGHEASQHTAVELPHLTPSEAAVYRGLRLNQWAQGVRLEQERINWSMAWQALNGI